MRLILLRRTQELVHPRTTEQTSYKVGNLSDVEILLDFRAWVLQPTAVIGVSVNVSYFINLAALEHKTGHDYGAFL